MPPATHSFRFARSIALLSVAILLMTAEAGRAAPTLGSIEHWSGTSTSNWVSGGASLSNSGTGGVGGVSDGFLTLSVAFPSNLGATDTTDYVGNWTAAGITRVRLWLNDIGADEALEIHFGIGAANGGVGNFWQYNVGFIPPLHSSAAFTVDLSSASAFTHIIDSPPGTTFAAALAGVNRILLRHDVAPYGQNPDPLAGDFGVDDLLLTNSTTDVGPPPTGVRRPIQLAAPYPNPSSGPVAFALESYEAEPIRIEIVDVAGRAIRHATLAESSAGSRIWTWDGLGDGGERAAAGYYRVRAFGPSGGTSRPFVRLAP